MWPQYISLVCQQNNVLGLGEETLEGWNKEKKQKDEEYFEHEETWEQQVEKDENELHIHIIPGSLNKVCGRSHATVSPNSKAGVRAVVTLLLWGNKQKEKELHKAEREKIDPPFTVPELVFSINLAGKDFSSDHQEATFFNIFVHYQSKIWTQLTVWEIQLLEL